MSSLYRLSLVGPMRPYRGGIAHFTEAVASGLSERGHTVDAVSFTRQYPDVLFPGKTQLDPTASLPSVPTERLIDSVQPWTWQRAARHLREQRPDAIVFNHWMPFFGPSYGWMARRAKRPALALVHNALPHEPRPGDRLLSRYFFRVVQGFVVLSDHVRDDLRTLGVTAPIHVVPHPTYTHFGDALPQTEARRQIGLDGDGPLFLFFGLVRRYKGLHILLDAWPRVVAAYPDARLMVAGEFYDDEADYRNQIAQHGVAESVILHNRYLPDDEVAAYFSAADAVVQPYVTATQSGVAQVAFQFDTPLIVTDVGGLPEIVPDGEAGLVVPSENPPALAESLIRFIRDDLAAPLAEGVRRQRARYGWAPLLDALEALTEQVTAGNDRPPPLH
ncbi:MAG: glycosyltransferase family 4 protein [Rhodothermales bacterium]